MADGIADIAVINPPACAHSSGRASRNAKPAVSLLHRCKAGDERAWAALFSQRAGQVYRWAVLLGLTPAEAEDAAQEVLATAARRIERCAAEEAMTSWLYQITRRVVANCRRLSWWRRWLPGAEPEAAQAAFSHETAREAERELDIRRCIARLPRAQAEVLVLMDIEGFTREEVAEMLRIAPGTVASRLRLARQAFRAGWALEVDTSTPGLSWENP